MNSFTYSGTGLKMTESFESCSLESYWDALGQRWSIGWGHTGSDVVSGMKCTSAQADAWLEEDMKVAEEAVNRYVTVEITQPEFDALCDFTYNAGSGSLEHSTLLKDLNAGNFTAAAAQFDLWDHDLGKVVAGLLRRRQAETALFQEPA